MRSTDDHSFSVNQFSVPRLSLDDLARISSTHGASGIGVLRGTLDELGASSVSRVLADHGLLPTSVCVALGLVGATAEERSARRVDAAEALASACSLGAPLVVVPGGPARELGLAEARRQFAEAFAELADLAEHWGGRILVEPLGAASVHLSCLTTLSSALELTRTLPATAVVLDVWHVWTDPDLEDALSRDADQIDVVHLSDWPAGPTRLFERCLPGTGLISLDAIVQRLLAAGYAGWWELEVPVDTMAQPVPEERLVADGLRRARGLVEVAVGAGRTEVQACAS